MALLAAGSAAGCDIFGTDPAAGDNDGAQDSAAREAPALAERVANGDLPPVADRLPDNPLVVRPWERPGVYGSTWNTALLGPADTAWLDRTIGYEQFMRWDVDWTEPLPNLLEGLEPSADGTTYTLHLRPGVKWSDGEPYTTDDLIFFYQDIFGHPNGHFSFPSFTVLDEQPPTVE